MKETELAGRKTSIAVGIVAFVSVLAHLGVGSVNFLIANNKYDRDLSNSASAYAGADNLLECGQIPTRIFAGKTIMDGRVRAILDHGKGLVKYSAFENENCASEQYFSVGDLNPLELGALMNPFH